MSVCFSWSLVLSSLSCWQCCSLCPCFCPAALFFFFSFFLFYFIIFFFFLPYFYTLLRAEGVKRLRLWAFLSLPSFWIHAWVDDSLNCQKLDSQLCTVLLCYLYCYARHRCITQMLTVELAFFHLGNICWAHIM